MARKKDYLLEQAESLGVAVAGKTADQLMDDIRDILCKGRDLLPQVAPMLCEKSQQYYDFSIGEPWASEEMKRRFWDNPLWIAEEKIDGARFKMHIAKDYVRIDSRRRSDKDYAYVEKTDNFPQFHLSESERLHVLELAGSEQVILDGEMFMPVAKIDTGSVVTDSCLNATVALCNSSPEISIPLQRKYGWMQFRAFDIIIEDMMYKTRYPLLEEIVDYLCEVCPIMIPSSVADNKLAFYEGIVARGGEGVVFKRLNGLYECGVYSRNQYKCKKFESVDAFITGYKPGEHGHTGLVGALCVSVLLDGEPFEIGAVSGFSDELRQELSAPDGSLKPEFYDRVVECRYQELTKTSRMRHAVFVGFRPDKSKYDCVAERGD